MLQELLVSQLPCKQHPATCNASDGTATVSVTGGSGDFSYAWTPSVSNGSSATGLTSGYYSVLITDNQGGCAQTVSALVGNTSGITASLVSSTNAHCENSEDGRATVSASGGMAPYEYLWQPSGDISASVNNLAPGEYIVRVSDYNNCPAYLTVNIGYDFAIPSIDLGPDTVWFAWAIHLCWIPVPAMLLISGQINLLHNRLFIYWWKLFSVG